MTDVTKIVNIRRFSKADQNEVATIFVNGLRSYDTVSNDIKKIQVWFTESKLAEGGDMNDIYLSYKIEEEEAIVDRNFWVATIDDQIVGCIGCIPSTVYDDAKELVRMSVKAEYRRHGVARKLIDHLSSWILSKGFKKVNLDTLTAMEAAIKFYKAVGFHITHEEVFDISSRKLDLADSNLYLTHLLKDLSES